MNDARAKYMTIDAFRREYFVAGSRPTRASVRSWIESGRLPAIRLDNRVYVRDDHAEMFLQGAKIEERIVDKAKSKALDWKIRQEQAKEQLRAFGINV